MATDSPRAARVAVRRRRRKGEEGYVLVMTALLLIPLMVFAAFSVDVGSWYHEATRVQNAADAAALAGVTHLPDFDEASAEAYAIAALNGYEDQPGNFDDPTAPLPQIQVRATTDQQLIVEIRTAGETYFGTPVYDGPVINRFAVAEYILPAPLGNPTGRLGVGTNTVDFAGGGALAGDNMWLAVNDRCGDISQGDLIASSHTQPGGGWLSCNSASRIANPYYDATGYLYVITVPPGAGAVDVEVLNAGACGSSNSSDWGGTYASPGDEPAFGGNSDPELLFSLYPPDNTPLDDSDNVDPARQVLTNAARSRSGCGWETLYTIPSSAANEGRWVLTVGNTTNDENQDINIFGLMASEAGGVCDARIQADCVTINAVENLNVYVGRDAAAAGASATFPFVEVDGEHGGKQLQIDLWDAAEGMRYLEILDPAGNTVPFSWEMIDCDRFPAGYCGTMGFADTDGSSANIAGCSANCLDVTGDIFQHRWARLTVSLPANPCNGADCWWQVRYTPQGSGTVTDRTTWSIQITGDPVRLVE